MMYRLPPTSLPVCAAVTLAGTTGLPFVSMGEMSLGAVRGHGWQPTWGRDIQTSSGNPGHGVPIKEAGECTQTSYRDAHPGGALLECAVLRSCKNAYVKQSQLETQRSACHPTTNQVRGRSGRRHLQLYSMWLSVLLKHEGVPNRDRRRGGDHAGTIGDGGIKARKPVIRTCPLLATSRGFLAPLKLDRNRRVT
ncbi:hypothetical protein C8Q70DRAFT_100213 [Cubamyces menziesii]|nr:hypothetical protein C8Q70DRAFT_100213 [Cubamyces menziesii]